jgi:hypothetical protein
MSSGIVWPVLAQDRALLGRLDRLHQAWLVRRRQLAVTPYHS